MSKAVTTAFTAIQTVERLMVAYQMQKALRESGVKITDAQLEAVYSKLLDVEQAHKDLDLRDR